MTSTTLTDYLEQYLKQEGLQAAIPEHRRPSSFPMPVTVIWMAAAWCLTTSLVLRHRGTAGLIVGLVGPPALFIAFLVAVTVGYAITNVRSGKQLAKADAGTLGGLFLFGFPPIAAAALGLYLQSWLAALECLGGYFVATLAVLLLQGLARRLHLLLEFLRSVFRGLSRSVATLRVLVPVLVVAVLLSAFSQELWEALGTLTPPRLSGAIACLILPLLWLVPAAAKRETAALVHTFPTAGQLIDNAESTPFIRDKLRQGFIGDEEWGELRHQLEWRHLSRMADEIAPILERKANRWLALSIALVILMSLFVFLVYFLVVFTMLLQPVIVAKWTGTALETLTLSIGISGYSHTIPLPSTFMPVARVSLLLAVFTAIAAGVYLATDDAIREILTEWLSVRISSWTAVTALYYCGIAPNYQVWEYLVRDRKKGIANVSIVVPQRLSDATVREACEHMESCLKGYERLVIITAFQVSPEKPVYKLGMPGMRWRLLHNKTKDIREFEPIPLELGEVRYQHSLGRDSLKHGEKPPDEWFGDEPNAIGLAKAVWSEDVHHEWVLHPWALSTAQFLSLEVWLTKRMAGSAQYREYMRSLLALTRDMRPDAPLISIDLYYRDSVDSLARLDWTPQYVSYRDEMIQRTTTEMPSVW